MGNQSFIPQSSPIPNSMSCCPSSLSPSSWSPKAQSSMDSTGSQNIQQIDSDEMDECSPSSKFDIKFLRTSIRASDIKLTDVQFSTSKDNANTAYRSFLVPHSKNQIKKILEEWSVNFAKKQKKQFQGTDLLKTKNKLDAIKSYSNFLNRKTSQFLNIKINGEIFYKIREQAISPYYQILRKIGQGSFGSVYKGKCLKTGEMRAIKILKKKIMNQSDQKSLLQQINVLKKMDHINIIKLYDVFFYKNFFYVVTEYCQGGSLLQALQKNQIKSQKQVAIIIKQLFSALSYMHNLKIAHRDLKLDNIVLVKEFSPSSCSPSSSQSSQHPPFKTCIKLIDFGLAQFLQNDTKNRTGIVGTISYMAPQIFNGFFSCKSDVWSCGIVLCMLLIGFNPFKRKKQALTVKAISDLEINFKSDEWGRVSAKARNLIGLMLVKRADKRISIDQALNHQWIKSLTSRQNQMMGSDYKSEMVISNFNNYHRGSNFICYIKNFLISRQLTQAMRQQMALIFQKIDTDSSGVIETHELFQLYSIVSGTPSSASTASALSTLLQKIDQNHSGRIDFQQFLLCMTNSQLLHNLQCIDQAFNFFDEDRTGYIERRELLQCLEGCQEEEIRAVLMEVDFNGDGKISREEFKGYLMGIGGEGSTKGIEQKGQVNDYNGKQLKNAGKGV